MELHGVSLLSETCRVSCQNKVMKLVHLVGFIMKNIVTMHGHMNVKKTLHVIWSALHFSEFIKKSLK